MRYALRSDQRLPYFLLSFFIYVFLSLSLSTENSEGEKGSLLVYLVASAVFF